MGVYVHISNFGESYVDRKTNLFANRYRRQQ